MGGKPPAFLRHGGNMRTDLKLTPEEIRAIEDVLAKEERIMLIPTRDKIKIVRVRNEEIRVDKKTQYLTEY